MTTGTKTDGLDETKTEGALDLGAMGKGGGLAEVDGACGFVLLHSANTNGVYVVFVPE